jgi:acetyltransferase-like isoleucine patch superfamily enzyme
MGYSDEAEDLVLGKDVTIGEGARIAGGKIVLGDGVVVGRRVDIEVTDRLVVGKGSLIRDGTILHGRRIELGREFYANHDAEIGGGSCFEATSSLKIGYWFHLGSYAMVNTAMPVTIGNEVGLGRFTNLYTHGAYLSMAEGFPVTYGPITLGDRVWLPSATVNPGVTIGDDVVVGVGSLVMHDIPSNSLAVGVPAKVVKEHYPARPPVEDVIGRVRAQFDAWGVRGEYDPKRGVVRIGSASFHIPERRIDGSSSKETERVRNLLRRLGIRFRYEVVDGAYAPWSD